MCRFPFVITPHFLKYYNALPLDPFCMNKICLKFHLSRLVDFTNEWITPYCLCFPAQSIHKWIPRWIDAHLGFFFSQSMQIYMLVFIMYIIIILVTHCSECLIADWILYHLCYLMKMYLLSFFCHFIFIF